MLQKKILSLFIVGTTVLLFAQEETKHINPFSKIRITSNKAICKKIDTDCFRCVYETAVRISLADKSTVTCDTLTVLLQKNQSVNKKFTISTAELVGDVIFESQQHRAQADKAYLHVDKKKCVLEKNVTIKQKKHTSKDVPMDISSNKAIINLETHELLLEGDADKPVETVIVLDGHPSITKFKNKN